MSQAKIDQILGLCAELSVEEQEQLSKDLKKLLFRCRVQEKIDLRREDVAQRLSEAMDHRMDKVAGGD
jgi:ribosomal protein L29